MPEAEAEAAKAALQRPGFTVNQDGTRLPLGPEVEVRLGLLPRLFGLASRLARCLARCLAAKCTLPAPQRTASQL